MCREDEACDLLDITFMEPISRVTERCFAAGVDGYRQQDRGAGFFRSSVYQPSAVGKGNTNVKGRRQ